jgi:hypothetical protein
MRLFIWTTLISALLATSALADHLSALSKPAGVNEAVDQKKEIYLFGIANAVAADCASSLSELAFPHPPIPQLLWPAFVQRIDSKKQPVKSSSSTFANSPGIRDIA